MKFISLLLIACLLGGCTSHKYYKVRTVCYLKPLDKKGNYKLCFIKKRKMKVGVGVFIRIK